MCACIHVCVWTRTCLYISHPTTRLLYILSHQTETSFPRDVRNSIMHFEPLSRRGIFMRHLNGIPSIRIRVSREIRAYFCDRDFRSFSKWAVGGERSGFSRSSFIYVFSMPSTSPSSRDVFSQFLSRVSLPLSAINLLRRAQVLSLSRSSFARGLKFKPCAFEFISCEIHEVTDNKS